MFIKKIKEEYIFKRFVIMIGHKKLVTKILNLMAATTTTTAAIKKSIKFRNIRHFCNFIN